MSTILIKYFNSFYKKTSTEFSIPASQAEQRGENYENSSIFNEWEGDRVTTRVINNDPGSLL